MADSTPPGSAPPEPRGPVLVHVAGRTDVGLVREHNEDRFLVVDLDAGVRDASTEPRLVTLGKRGLLLLVCDGMGGAAAGEVASGLAVETLADAMAAGEEPRDADAETRRVGYARRLREAAWLANRRILEAAQDDPTKSGMGTTMTAVGVLDRHLVIAQVGDSRAYLLRSGTLTQLTRDQSLVNQLLETGQITEEQAAIFEHSNVILQALGVQEDVEVQLSSVELRRGDRLVVCSDGLTGVVSDEEVAALAHLDDDVSEDCRVLIEVARNGGGPDNITAVVARFEGEGLDPPRADEPPTRYERWRLDEEEPAPDDDGSRDTPTLDEYLAARDGGRPRRTDPAQLFFSTMMLFAIALGSLVLGAVLYRSSPSGRCLVIAAAGRAVRVDGYDTGRRTRLGGTSVKVPLGRHRLALRGGAGGAVDEQVVEVAPGTQCVAQFEVPR